MAKLEVSVCVALAVLVQAGPSRAFCRTSSCELGEEDRLMSGGDECLRDAGGCVTEGNPLHWATPCLTFAIQRDGSSKAGISADAFRGLVQRAFDAWQGVTCPGGGSPRFQAQFQGMVECHRREAVCGNTDKNVNVVMLHDTGWPDAPTTIGLTRPSGGTVSGLIIDADLEINSQDFDFSSGATGPGALDLSQVLAHEVGHFLGLSHSDATGALMARDYSSLQLSRELLTADDIAAICTAFPPGEPLQCAAPAAPAYDTCQLVPGEAQECVLATMTHDGRGSGCSVGPGMRASSSWPGSLLLLGLVSLVRRRRA